MLLIIRNIDAVYFASLTNELFTNGNNNNAERVNAIIAIYRGIF